MTSKIKKTKMPTHVLVTEEDGMPEDFVVLLKQIRTINKRRLKGYITSLDKNKMKQIDAGIIISLGITQLQKKKEVISA